MMSYDGHMTSYISVLWKYDTWIESEAVLYVGWRHAALLEYVWDVIFGFKVLDIGVLVLGDAVLGRRHVIKLKMYDLV